ncbi:MAG TPA: response regulator [Caulobacteraceae bacterium]
MSEHEPIPGAGIPPEHLAALSHELRTPLSGVLGMARLLATTPLTAEQLAYVRALEESGEHLLGLVNDVLDYARLGAAHLALQSTEVDLEELLRSVCELMSPKAHEKGIEIGWAAQPRLPRILADEGRLRQILLNFAGNAVKFVTSGGVLILAEVRPANGIRLSVVDTGPGVPREARESVFEPFRRLDHVAGVDAGGAGLGLAIVRRIAEAMGGRVGVEGQENEGATFWFEAETPVRAHATAPAPLRGLVVAIASPNPIVREGAARQVEASGGKALRAASVEEALDLSDPTSVVVADHAEAGAGLLRRARGRRVVIMMRPEERSIIGAYRRAGFAGYLIKPLRRTSLILRVLAAAGATGASSIPEDERAAPEPTDVVDSELIGARILLAEDNPVNALLARTLLTRLGCEVEHVADGVAVIAAAAKSSYDLVLMDVRMPAMGGIEATRKLRAAGVAAPVVALTANAFEDDRAACLAAGMDDFLIKPISLEALRPALERWTRAGWTPLKSKGRLAG